MSNETYWDPVHKVKVEIDKNSGGKFRLRLPCLAPTFLQFLPFYTCKGKKVRSNNSNFTDQFEDSFLNVTTCTWQLTNISLNNQVLVNERKKFRLRLPCLAPTFLQFLPLCERWFWKEVHYKKWVESHLQNCTRKEWKNDNVKTTAAFKMFFQISFVVML